MDKIGLNLPTLDMGLSRQRFASSSLSPIGRVAFALLATGALLGTPGCGSKPTNTSGNPPERQAEAEADLAVDLLHRGQYQQALDHARKSVELNEEYDKGLYVTSLAYLAFCAGPKGIRAPACRLKDAEDYARRALAQTSSFRDARNLLGQILIESGKAKEAIPVLEPLTKDPAYATPHLVWGNLGWAQVLTGDVDGGIASLKNSVAEPRFCVGHYRLGMAYERKGALDLADKSFSEAVNVAAPECQNLQIAWEARGRLRMKQGRLDDAKRDYEKCREISEETDSGVSCVRALKELGGKS